MEHTSCCTNAYPIYCSDVTSQCATAAGFLVVRDIPQKIIWIVTTQKGQFSKGISLKWENSHKNTKKWKVISD